MKKLLPVLLLVFFAFDGSAQYAYKTGHTELVRRNGFMKLKGWNFAPGVTWMAGRFKNSRDVLNDVGDQNYGVTYNPGGRIGLYLEAGRHHIFKHARLFPYMDYGIAYKGLRGKETWEADWLDENTGVSTPAGSGEGKFANHNIGAHFNLNNIIQLSNRLFIQNSIGANVDYSIILRSEKDQASNETNVDLPRLWAQLHYKFGLGIKINDEFFIIPTIETPVVNFSPWTNFRLKVPKFMSWYRPLILSVRFAFLKQNTTDCPPVYDPANGGNNDPNFK